MTEKLLTPAQTAGHLQVTEHTVYDWLSKGKMHSLKVGCLWRVPEPNLDRFLAGDYGDDHDDLLTAEEIAKSESAWHAYLSGEDSGTSLDQVKRELLGGRSA